MRRLPSPMLLALLLPLLLPLLVAAAPLGAQAPAPAAAPVDFPLAMIDRPPVLPRGAARLDVSGLLVRQPGAPDQGLVVLGGGVAVLPNLEMGGQLVPVALRPGAPRFASPSLYATYARVAGAWTFAPTAQVVLPLATREPFTVDAGVSVTYGIPRVGNLVLAPTLSLNTRQNDQGTSLSVPFTWMHQAGAHFNWQLTSGVGLSRFDPRFGLSRRADALRFDDTTVPLSGILTWSLARARDGGRARPLADLGVQWQWPQLWTHAPASRGFSTRDWSVQLTTSWYAIP